MYLYLLYVFCFVIVYSLFCIVVFMYIYMSICIVCTSVRTTENPIAVNNNNNNNNNNIFPERFTYCTLQYFKQNQPYVKRTVILTVNK
jgi:hypothetical protein